MSKTKKILFIFAYFLLLFITFKLNSVAIIDWLNKSMFEDFTINADNINNSFYNGVSLIFLITILIYSVVGTFIISLLITDLLLGALVFANNVKVIERNEFITFSELQNITSPKELLSFIDVTVGFAVFVVIIILIVLFGIHYLSVKIAKKIDFRINRKIRIVLFIVSLALLVTIFEKPNLYNEFILEYEESDKHNWNPLKRAQSDGFLPSFLHTVKPTYMDKPETYNKMNAEEINEKYTNLSKEINKDRKESIGDTQTILYLSESLIDPKSVPNILMNETSIPYITKIMKDNTGGTMYSQYIGGGTANIEWSILTSFSLEVFNQPMAITPYSDFYAQSKKHQTILNYYTNDKIAIHPYTAHLYKRRTIYEAIGFDDFLYLENGIEHTDRLGTHYRVSDESLNKDILRVANKEDTGLIHVLSMQNHSPYNREILDMAYKPVINTDIYPEEDKDELYNYLQGTRASDEAIKTLINELNKSNKEFNLLFYGDHFPNLFNGLDDDLTEDTIHETPWFLYVDESRRQSNIHYKGISPIFFVPILLKEGNYIVSPFHALMDKLLNKGVKRIGKDFIITEEGIVKDSELPKDLLDLITDYRIIEYDSLFGNNWLPDSFYNLN